jgi:hypothetical protein
MRHWRTSACTCHDEDAVGLGHYMQAVRNLDECACRQGLLDRFLGGGLLPRLKHTLPVLNKRKQVWV